MVRGFWGILSFLAFFVGVPSAFSGSVQIQVEGDFPSGTVSAFDTECPTGWTEETDLQNHFVMGLDPSDIGQNVGDVSNGQNPVYNTTLDLFAPSINPSNVPTIISKLCASGAGPTSAEVYNNAEAPSVTLQTTGENKPPNVVLRHCRKE